MARYSHPTGKDGKKYYQTDPVYGTFSKEAVDAGMEAGEFVLMEKIVHAKMDGHLVGRPDRRFMPKAQVPEKEKRGWKVVSLSGAERAASIPSEVTKRGPGRPRKEAE